MTGIGNDGYGFLGDGVSGRTGDPDAYAACVVSNCGERADYHLHRPSSECVGCKAPADHHVFKPNDPEAAAARVAKRRAARMAIARLRDYVFADEGVGNDVRLVIEYAEEGGKS